MWRIIIEVQGANRAQQKRALSELAEELGLCLPAHLLDDPLVTALTCRSENWFPPVEKTLPLLGNYAPLTISVRCAEQIDSEEESFDG